MKNIFEPPARIDFRDPRTGLTLSRAWRSWIKQSEVNINGNLQAVSVVDIDDPSTELVNIGATKDGDILIAYESTNENINTIYAWDTDTTLTANSPYVVDGYLGFWIAVAGKYTNQSINIISTQYIVFGNKWRFGLDGDDLVLQVSKDSGATWSDVADSPKWIYDDYP